MEPLEVVAEFAETHIETPVENDVIELLIIKGKEIEADCKTNCKGGSVEFKRLLQIIISRW